MKIFLTGGSGYVGKATISALVRHGHGVEALARNDRAAETVRAAGAKPVRGGLGDLGVLNAAAAHAEAVIHLAQAETGDEDLAAATAMQDGIGSGTYVHTGGTWVYGDTDGVVDETAPWNPCGPGRLAQARRGRRPAACAAGWPSRGGTARPAVRRREPPDRHLLHHPGQGGGRHPLHRRRREPLGAGAHRRHRGAVCRCAQGEARFGVHAAWAG